MEEVEFPTSPSKRRRTESPVGETPNSIPPPAKDENPNVSNPESAVSRGEDNKPAAVETTGASTSDSAPDLLNVLMAEVEAQSRSDTTHQRVDQQETTQNATSAAEGTNSAGEGNEVPEKTRDKEMHDVDNPKDTQEEPAAGADESQPAEAASGEREWETDSSPYSSSTDSSDDSSDEDSDEAGDNDYPLLSPTEQARILMEDAGSDDEGAKGKGTGGALRTAHELAEEPIPKPDIVVTPEMRIEELGEVEAVVEGTVLIKGKTTGEYQVLEFGSVLCLEDRSVIGVIADTVGRVQQPLYTVRFASDQAVAEAGVAEKGTRIFYVADHSNFVFTQPLKGAKGSDASNFHDEEVGDDEMEFSDDEKEAEHKRMLKLRKKGVDVESLGSTHSGRGGMHNRGGRGGGGGGGGSRGRGRGGFQPSLPAHPESTNLNYDDTDGGDYEPLRRTSAMHEEAQTTGGGSLNQQDYTPHRRFDGRRGNDQRGRRGNRGRGGSSGGGNFQQNHRPYQNNNFQQTDHHAFQQQQQQPQSWTFNQQQQQQPQQWVSPSFPQLPGMPGFFNPAAMTMAAAAAAAANNNNGGGLNFSQLLPGFGQQYNSQAQGYGQQQQYSGGSSSSDAWANNNNQTAAQQVMRQLEELRRASGGQGSPN